MNLRLAFVALLATCALVVVPKGASATGGPTAETALPLPIGVPFSTDTTTTPNADGGFQTEDWYSVSLVAGDTVTITVQNTATWDSGLGGTGLNICATQLAWPHGPSPNRDGHELGPNGSWVPCADGGDIDISGLGIPATACGGGPCRNQATSSFTVVPGGAGNWVIGFDNSDALTYQATVTVAHHGQQQAAPVVVSLGDSYSSGEGNPPYDAGTDEAHDDRCHRSPSAWPRQLGVSAQNHLACSGAKIQDFYSGQHKHAPDNAGQIARLHAIAQSQKVADVLVGISGNDLGFAHIIRTCVTGIGCLANIDGVEKPKLAGIEKRLVQAYKDIKQAAPGARRIVVGYPSVIPSGTTVRCSWLSKTEQARALRVQEMLEATIKHAAQQAGASFVSVLSATRGHELCKKRSWFVPVATAKVGNPLTNQQQGHPTAQAQRAIAQIVRRALAPPAPAPGTEPSLASRIWYGFVQDYAIAPYPGMVDPFGGALGYRMSSLTIEHPTSTTSAGSMVTAVVAGAEEYSCNLTFVRHDGTGWYYHVIGGPSYDTCIAASGTLRILPVTEDALLCDWQPDDTSDGPGGKVATGLAGIFGNNANDRNYTPGGSLEPPS